MGGPVESRGKIDWSVIFDLIASEYGYDWSQFVSMTYKMLDACMEAISRRTHNKTVVQAAMHGIKMDLYRRHKPVSEKDLDNARSEIEKLLKEKQVSPNGK